ncbi:hypothetical protein ACH5RR_012312 [Cinchona calisaya]|uniref:Uncharacterized protein n=1 Tax=Cinchona calisaya TaxID=153742 RepID=A0ABD3A7B8_9GENT
MFHSIVMISRTTSTSTMHWSKYKILELENMSLNTFTTIILDLGFPARMARTRKRRFTSHDFVDESCEEHEDNQSLIQQQHYYIDGENTSGTVLKKMRGPTHMIKVWGRPSSLG